MHESQHRERCRTLENRIPQHGWVLDTDLASALGVSRETLIDWLHKYKIDYGKPGCRALIHMETFFAGLPSGLSDGQRVKHRRQKTEFELNQEQNDSAFSEVFDA